MFGICTDLHHDLIFDSHKHLGAFINAMNESNVDFIIQLGDFCFTQSHNRSILDLWNTFDSPSYHVIGNHDLEFSTSVDEVVDFYGMVAAYYSFDFNGESSYLLDPVSISSLISKIRPAIIETASPNFTGSKESKAGNHYELF